MGFEAGARKLNRIERDGLLILLGLTLTAGIAKGSVPVVLGLFLGGVLMLANFHFLWRFARRALEREDPQKRPFLAGLFFLFLLFLGGVAFCLLVLQVPVIPFFIGTLSLLASIFLNSLLFV